MGGLENYRNMPELLELLADITETIKANRNYRRALVYQAREHGYTWAEIGQALGITKQAAQQKYSNNVPEREREFD